jgi:hypothetical protein
VEDVQNIDRVVIRSVHSYMAVSPVSESDLDIAKLWGIADDSSLLMPGAQAVDVLLQKADVFRRVVATLRLFVPVPDFIKLFEGGGGIDDR